MDPSPNTPLEPQRPPSLDRQTRLLLALVVVAALVALFWPRGESSTAPGGTLVDAQGRPQPMASLLTQVTLLHLWATWCPPCLAEIPQVLRLERDLAELPGFRVLLVAVADNQGQVEGFLGKDDADRVLYDPRWEISTRLGTRQLPETYLLVGGKEIEKFVGATEWDDPAIRARIRAAAEDAAH
jgi:thiol-disulfide isomerase/thioredoxin